MKAILVILCLCKCVYSATPVVKVEQGSLSGKEYTTSNGKNINAFLGVPYAAPPTGDNRFKEPQELKRWERVLDASSQKSQCIQVGEIVVKDNFPIVGNEDCLYLNIYTPKLPADGKNPHLDVIVFVHGGAFMFGTGNDKLPDYLLGIGDVVFVTFNYRLGVLGFFSTNDEHSTGNFGLKDQAFALKWIKANIENFGGNPKSITIVGFSAGAASVHYHMISSATEELFQRAITFSGTSLNPWALTKNAVQKSKLLASIVGCSNANNEEMMKCLRGKPASSLIEAYKHFSLTSEFPLIFLFGPVVEPKNPNAFLIEEPKELLKSGKVKDIPWLISTVKNEGLFPGAVFIQSEAIMKTIDMAWTKIAPIMLNYDDITSEEKKNEISSKIKNFYFAGKSIGKETTKQFIELISDRQFFNGIINSIELYNSAIKNNIYYQKFSYRGEHSLTSSLTGNTENYGVCHGDDLQYYLKKSDEKLNTESDQAMSKLVSSIIVNFAASGTPNKAVPNWEPVSKTSKSDIKFLNVYSATDVKMEQISEDSPTLKFWKTTFGSEQEQTTTEKPSSSCKHFVATYLVMFAVSMAILFK